MDMDTMQMVKTEEQHPEDVKDSKRKKTIWTYAVTAIVDVVEVVLSFF